MSADDDGEKEHEPTQKKLDEARRRGEIVRSADLSAAAGLGGLVLALLGFGPPLVAAFGSTAMAFLEGAVRLVPAGQGGPAVLWPVGAALLPMLPILALPALAVLAALALQRAFVLAPAKLRPRLSRIDPVANAKQKFGRTGLLGFGKSLVKLLVVATLLAVFLKDRLPEIFLAQGEDGRTVAARLFGLLTDFLVLVLLANLALGAADYLLQRHEHLRRNRMSRQELLEEFKQSEGDPHVKGQRRRRAEAIATNRMLADVPKADVVIVNPTHYAVALRWSRASGRAPVCIAKGTDEIAARIRAAAVAAGVPVRPDPPTARAIYASVKVGQEILPGQYAPVAAAIRFAEQMRLRARERRGR